MQKPVLVIKLGTAVLTTEKGEIGQSTVRKVAAGIAALSNDYRMILVSSGAVGSGKSFFSGYKGTLAERKAAAAVGNPILIRHYQKHFSAYNIPVAQALCERQHFSSRPRFLQLKETFEEFWKNGILPVMNENDLVSNVELKFSDNDELATLTAIGFDAETLLLCTSVGGFMDSEKRIIPVVEKVDARIMSYVQEGKSSLGLGGMLSKLTFTRLATSLGIRVVICGLGGPSPFADALAGKTGTSFIPRVSNLRARQKWLASGSITLGSLYLDRGAIRALERRHSLLSVGIRRVQGKFAPGEVVQLKDEEEQIIGVAKVKLGAGEMTAKLENKNTIAAHADDIVLF
ncbi:glutamate 5-kinase [Puia sp.]|uniref:glutamate 5-kinase n=1 Tax=Puia sp. TaxID=2045100 RepID=UPI002F3EB622